MSALIQQTEEWLEFRKNKVGGSDAPIIMEVSPWKTPYQLWQEKCGIISGNFETSAMRRGKELESRARESFVRQIGKEFEPNVKIHPNRDWQIASLDGITSNHDLIVEIKCPGYEDHHFADATKMVPEKYYPQLQHQMEVTGLNMAYYFSYIDDSNNIILEIERDDKYIEKMIKKEERFYQCIRNFIAPELTDKDYVCKNDSEWNDVVNQWLECNKYIQKEKELKEKLVNLSQGKNCKGCGVTIQKIFRRGNVDYSKIEALKNIDLEDYRKESSEYWKITKD